MAQHFYRYDGDQDLDVYGDNFKVTAVKTGDVVELSEPTLAGRPDWTEVDGTGKDVADPAPAPPFLLDPPEQPQQPDEAVQPDQGQTDGQQPATTPPPAPQQPATDPTPTPTPTDTPAPDSTPQDGSQPAEPA